MDVKKAIKKIVALGIGGTMLVSTLTGALAYDLSNYPTPFVMNGNFDAMIVVGEKAETGDVLGSIDIASNLQYNAAVAVDVGTGSLGEVTISEGEKIEKGSDDLSLHEALNDVVIAFDRDDFDGLLEDGTIEDDDEGDYDFDQEIALGSAEIIFDNPDDNIYDMAMPMLDIKNAGDDLLTFTITFDEDVLIGSDDTDEGFRDGETITMFGKKMTFDQNLAADDDIILYGSDKTVIIKQGETVTINSAGKDYDITVSGGNSDQSNAIVSVNSETKTLEAGDSRTLGGLEVYVDDVFISNIGTSEVSVSLFVGSEKWTLPAGDTGADTLKIDDNDVDGVEAEVEAGTDNTDVEAIVFTIDPSQMENEELDEDFDWLAMGDDFVEPLFGFKLAFDSVTPEIMGNADSEFELKKSGDDLVMVFETNGGDDCNLPLLTETAGDIVFHEDIATDSVSDMMVVTAGNDVDEDMIFILAEQEDNDPLTKIYQITGLDDDKDQVELKELCSGKTITVGEGKEIESTGVFVDDVDEAGEVLVLDSDTLDYVYTKYDMKVTIPDAGAAVELDTETLEFELDEDVNGDRSEDVAGTAGMTIQITSDEGDDEIDITDIDDYDGDESTEENDHTYVLTEYGTYFDHEDDDKDYVKVYIPSKDRKYNMFLAPTEAVIMSSGSSSSKVMQPVKIQAGASVLDTEISGYTNKNLIIVGGPAANRAAAAVLGLEFPSYGADSTIPENAAIIKLIAHGNGKHALLVAGWEADDTRRAARVLAEFDKHSLSGTEVMITGTSMSDLKVKSVE